MELASLSLRLGDNSELPEESDHRHTPTGPICGLWGCFPFQGAGSSNLVEWVGRIPLPFSPEVVELTTQMGLLPNNPNIKAEKEIR